MTARHIRGGSVCLLLTASLLFSVTSTIAAPHLRQLFGLERFTRGSGTQDVFRHTFTVPSYVVGPYTLTILNGQADGRGRVAVENSAIGTVMVNGVVVASHSDFSAKVGRIERTVSLSSTNVLEVTLAGAPGGFITVGITGVINIADLTKARSGHTAAVLDDGSVLVSGGDGASGPESSTERFNSLALTFTASGNLQLPRGQHSAAVLGDGRHLLAGGRDGGGALNGSELLDSQSAPFSAASGGLQIARLGHTATALIDGRVLIAGGRSTFTEGAAERFDAQPTVLFKPPYDAGAGAFSVLTHTLQQARWDHTATLLRDGRVLILGGRNDSSYLASSELFDPATNQFAAIAGMPEARAGHSATLLPDGRVLVLGGQNVSGYLNAGLLFDPANNTFAPALNSLIVARANHTATLLPFGEILVAGGDAGTGPIANTEMYGPPATDNTRPVISAVLPANAATGVDLTQMIGVRFSEPVNVATLDTGSVALVGSGPVDVSINASENGLLLFVLPTQRLLAGTRYVLTLTGQITDTSGNSLETVNFEFTTVGAPAISAVTPTEGPVGTSATILGLNFDAQPQMNVVKFGATPALVMSATATQLETVVPAGLSAGSVALSVTTRGGAATSSFLVENPTPVLTSMSPLSIRVGSGSFALSVFGSGFTTASSITFGNTVLTPLLQTATRLDVQVPAALVTTLGTRNVVVHNPAPGGGSSIALLFKVEGVVISGIAPASGPVGTLVRISGAGFDPVLSNNIVRFNGTPAVVTVASTTALETIVPAGAASGPVTVATSAGEASSSFTVTTGTRLLISKAPDQPVYSLGQSITIHTQLVDAQGHAVPRTVTLVSAPAAPSQVGSTFVFQASGTYTITATAAPDVPSGQPITASIPITVVADRAMITCGSPYDGAFLNQAPGAITFTGSVSAPGGVGTLMVNGAQVALGSNGAFSTSLNAARGINFVDLVMTDAAGATVRRTCAFMLGDIWAAEGQFLPNTVSFRAAPAAIDDLNRSGAVNSLGDILALVTNSTELRDALHATLQAANPLKSASCDLTVFVCVMSSRLRYVSSTLPGPNVATLALTEGGLVARMRFEDPTLQLRVDGHVAGISYDKTGTIGFDYIEQELILDVRVDSSGRPEISVRPGSVFVRVGPLHSNFSGIDGFIINTILTISEGPVRNMVAFEARRFGSETFVDVLDTLVGGLDVATVPPVFEVARLDGDTPIAVRADTRVSSFDTNGLRALAGVGLRFQTGAAHARPSLGVWIPTGSIIHDPLSSGQPAADAIHPSLLGQSLHALWRSGFFDGALTEGGLGGAVPAGATLRVTTALPPLFTLRTGNRVEFAIGAMNMEIDHPGLLADAVDSTVGARVSCDRRLTGEALTFENCTVDELHLSTDAALADATAAELRQLVSNVVRSIVSTAAQRSLPSLPVPGFRIADSLARYGLTPGAVLGIVNPTLETSGNHLVLRGGFAIR